ncbi:MAG: biopolymer transporter ExbD [Pseudomonadota bacterium]
MSRRSRAPRRKPEPVIALINVVFLMLIFFLVAGTVAPPLDPDLTLASGDDLEGRAPPDALVLRADGSLVFRGAETDPAAYLAARGLEVEEGEDGFVGAARLVPDRGVDAARLMEVALALRAAGASAVMVVAERGLQ